MLKGFNFKTLAHILLKERLVPMLFVCICGRGEEVAWIASPFVPYFSLQVEFAPIVVGSWCAVLRKIILMRK